MTNPLALTVALLASSSFILAGGEGEKKGGDKTAAKSTPSILKHLSGWGYKSANFDATLAHSMQVRVDYTNLDEGRDVMNVDVRKVRSSASGSVYGLDYKVQNDWVVKPESTPGRAHNSIKDAWLNWNIQDSDAYSIGVKLGQYKSAFGREFNTAYTDLEFMDRSKASQHFSGIRSRAATVHGSLKARGLNWAVSMANNGNNSSWNQSHQTGEGDDNTSKKLDYTFSINWSSNPKAVRLGGSEGALTNDAGFGLGFAHHKGYPKSPLSSVEDWTTESNNLWASWKNDSGFAANLELFTAQWSYSSRFTMEDEDGYSASLSWTAAAIPEQTQWGVAVRYSGIDYMDTQFNPQGGGMKDDNRFELVLNRYSVGHNMKTQFGLSQNSSKHDLNNHVEEYVLGVQTTVVF